MDKRQKYSMKEKVAPSSALRGEFPASPSRCGGAAEPQCSYMYGGLGDLRRQPYLLRSPLRENKTGPHQEDPQANPEKIPQRFCDSATAAARFRAKRSPDAAVKINPLLARPSSGADVRDATIALFHGQLSKIRRTKEREMMSVITEVANHGKKPL